MNIRIFFSSPGDVKMERETAKRIVDRLQSEIGGDTTIEPYFWEHEASPHPATLSKAGRKSPRSMATRGS
ncbi:MAG: hypothetical protein NWT08_04715 [Akkermansiaceae bacterium]|jgi:hypothetical protein|nr:hypothetical protein [Akkermansiaceae bacterium]MDP4647496.1 hypothetical protein [Akkermansiaceae bacterium]MDP4778606.1 hypothetical protein [Akkermansiaceae bacterium]MDP4848344.1 hypothetical protein [Akkermansiaceae bacterium]MDP4899215.1 hypothetical protein [Akkermansiaceae bacterium]